MFNDSDDFKEKRKPKNDDAQSLYDEHMRRMRQWQIGFIVAFILIGLLVVMTDSSRSPSQDIRFTVNYSSPEWLDYTERENRWCTQVQQQERRYRCDLVLYDENGVWFYVYRTHKSSENIYEFRDRVWEDMLADNADLDHEEEYVLDGQTAIARFYYYPEADKPEAYEMRLYVTDDTHMLEIAVWAESKAVFAAAEDKIFRVIHSLDFTEI